MGLGAILSIWVNGASRALGLWLPCRMRILISVASRYGATAEIADAVGERLRMHGHEVTLVAPDAVVDLSHVDAAVLASGVYMGRWLRPARAMVKRMGPQLRQLPVWLLSSGPVGDNSEASPEPVDLRKLIDRTQPRAHVVLPGRLDRENLRMRDKAVVGALRVPDGDFRDWDAVRAFADAIDEELRSGTS